MTPPTIAKRWTRRRERWVAPDAVFSPRHYSVDVVDGKREQMAKALVCEHHYAASYPASRLPVGLFGPRAELVGVAVFSQPTNDRVVAKHSAGVVSGLAGAELGRLVCLPSVGYNGESWFIARAFRFALEEKRIRCVVSFADPMERTTAAGLLTKRAHWGTIYQASNALYVGRSESRWLILTRDGRTISPRALSKIRNEERGWRYAAQQLLDAGAPERRLGESLREWVKRATTSPAFRRMKHPGNLTYVFGLNEVTRTALAAAHNGGLPYPERRAA